MATVFFTQRPRVEPPPEPERKRPPIHPPKRNPKPKPTQNSPVPSPPGKTPREKPDPIGDPPEQDDQPIGGHLKEDCGKQGHNERKRSPRGGMIAKRGRVEASPTGMREEGLPALSCCFLLER